MDFLQSLALAARSAWLRLRSNPGFVAASSAFVGVVGPALYQQVEIGAVDFSPAGTRKLILSGLAAAGLALVHLYAPPPAKPNLTPPEGPASEPPKGS